MDVGNVVRGDRVFDRLGVGLADESAAGDAAAGDREAEAVGPVVATTGEVDLGGAA